MNGSNLAQLLEKLAASMVHLHMVFAIIVYLGTIPTGLWLLWITYTTSGYWLSFLVLLTIVIGFKLGPAPFLAINCSWLHFQFHQFNLWVPIASYIVAIIMLINQLIAARISKG